MPDTLKPDALSWALTHVRRFGDTDIFPVPFEYDALAHDWNSIGPSLQSIDLRDYRNRPDSRVMVIKPGGGFRAALQLDPLDHLLYTAAVYEAAELLESARVPTDQNVACSYRLRITPEGAFFNPDSGWRDFHKRSKQLAEARTHPYVLVADISDFYNQLGQHRIQNALEAANVSAERSQNIEHFLNQLTAKQSQGLPVGPFASILLAEACLIDVDNFLLRRGVPYTRYVDDFHIFCTTRKQALETRHALSKYLFEVHRLSLESSKSSVIYIDKFLAEELNDPEEREKQARVERLNELLEQHAEQNGPYWYQEVTNDDEVELLSKAEKESFVSLFAECVTQRPLHLGLARHLLRKASKSRTSALNDLVFENLEALAPALRDTVRYIIASLPKKSAGKRSSEVIRFCRESAVGTLPFVRMWILELLRRRPDICGAADVFAIAEEAESELGLRPAALLAAAYKQLDWVRSRKEAWRNLEPWSRRSLIYSASILPSGEKRPFLSMVVEQGDLIDAAVAKHVLSQ